MSADLFVVVAIDRHADPYVALFTHLADAIEDARESARLNAHLHPEMIREYEPLGDWLFHIGWSTEGDHAYVLARTVDAEL